MKFEVIINKGDGSFHQNQTAVFEGSDFKIFKPRKWTSFKEGGFKILIHFGFSRKNGHMKHILKDQVWSTLIHLGIEKIIQIESILFYGKWPYLRPKPKWIKVYEKKKLIKSDLLIGWNNLCDISYVAIWLATSAIKREFYDLYMYQRRVS